MQHEELRGAVRLYWLLLSTISKHLDVSPWKLQHIGQMRFSIVDQDSYYDVVGGILDRY